MNLHRLAKCFAPAASTVFLLLLSPTSCLADDTYRSRPDLSPPRLNVTTRAADRGLKPGYLFISPFSSTPPGQPRVEQGGPYIFTDDGDLVWSGRGYVAPWAANFHVARWKDRDFLAVHEGEMNPLRGYSHGLHKLLDQHYRPVAEIRSAGHYISDAHEFEIVAGATTLVGSYTTRQADLSRWGGGEGQTWVIEYIFHEIDLTSGKGIFEWHSLDHVTPDESVLPLGSPAGSGDDSSTAWDYAHFNSITKGADGHYLLSARHTSTVYKINSTDGTVIWRLGGKFSDFTVPDDVRFGLQHHARYVDGALGVISVFDNSDGAGSSGKIIRLDFDRHEAVLQQGFYPPHHVFASSQGSLQVFDGGRGGLVNWGSEGQITEYDGSGRVLYHAFLGSDEEQAVTQNYRAFRANWTGFSSETPALVAEEEVGADGARIASFWVSWNGDTRTKSWRFWWSQPSLATNGAQPVRFSGETLRSGFETVFHLHTTKPISVVVAEALDEDGNVLVTSAPVKVFRSITRPGKSRDNSGNIVKQPSVEDPSIKPPTEEL
ncbi:ASST-domain-containing protein [Xylariales sp. PMI_506]|nr:ASST-domain-containing protein [Xylariales sp. PMI_506]